MTIPGGCPGGGGGRRRDRARQDRRETLSTKVSATRLREARTYLGFSPDDVATALDIERARFDDIENGQQNITGEELRKFSRLYRRPVAWLCGETTFQPSPEMLRQVENLTEGDREAILDFAEFLEGAGPAPKPQGGRRGSAADDRRDGDNG